MVGALSGARAKPAVPSGMISSTDASTSFGLTLRTPCFEASVIARSQSVLITRGMPRESSATLFTAAGPNRSFETLAIAKRW